MMIYVFEQETEQHVRFYNVHYVGNFSVCLCFSDYIMYKILHYV